MIKIYTLEDLNPHPLGAQRSNLIHLAQLTFGLAQLTFGLAQLTFGLSVSLPLKTGRSETRKRGFKSSRV
jgi:hypothetical protein